MHPSPKAVARRYLNASSQAVEVSGTDRLPYLSKVWEMVQTTYAAIGVKVSSASELLSDYDVWMLFFGADGEPVAFGLSKRTKFGIKSGLAGSDGSPEGKAATIRYLRMKFLQPGFYGEVSHKVKDIALAAGAPVVCSAYVEQVLGKPVEDVSAFEYRRNLSGVGPVVKVLVGRPRGIPTTSASNPDCPTEAPESSMRMGGLDSVDDETDIHAHYACLLDS